MVRGKEIRIRRNLIQFPVSYVPQSTSCTLYSVHALLLRKNTDLTCFRRDAVVIFHADPENQAS